MKSLFKVGDKVIVRRIYHPRSGPKDYPFEFIPEMIAYYGGKIVTINRVIPLIGRGDLRHCKHYVEPFKYKIENDPYCFSWSAAMFEVNIMTPTIF